MKCTYNILLCLYWRIQTRIINGTFCSHKKSLQERLVMYEDEIYFISYSEAKWLFLDWVYMQSLTVVRVNDLPWTGAPGIWVFGTSIKSTMAVLWKPLLQPTCFQFFSSTSRHPPTPKHGPLLIYRCPQNLEIFVGYGFNIHKYLIIISTWHWHTHQLRNVCMESRKMLFVLLRIQWSCVLFCLFVEPYMLQF